MDDNTNKTEVQGKLKLEQVKKQKNVAGAAGQCEKAKPSSMTCPSQWS